MADPPKSRSSIANLPPFCLWTPPTLPPRPRSIPPPGKIPTKASAQRPPQLLQFAMKQCPDAPTLWILENNKDARRLYEHLGFRPTGRVNAITGKLNEIEFQLKEE